MAVIHNWVLYSTKELKKQIEEERKQEEKRLKILNELKITPIYFIINWWQLYEWNVVSEEWEFYIVNVYNRRIWVDKKRVEMKVLKSIVRFDI